MLPATPLLDETTILPAPPEPLSLQSCKTYPTSLIHPQVCRQGPFELCALSAGGARSCLRPWGLQQPQAAQSWPSAHGAENGPEGFLKNQAVGREEVRVTPLGSVAAFFLFYFYFLFIFVCVCVCNGRRSYENKFTEGRVDLGNSH